MDSPGSHALTLISAFWNLLAEMSPWLWLGFLASFLIKWLLPKNSVAIALGGSGLRQTTAATLAGIPLPLCSCGVLPVAATLRREGASPSSVCAFTISTPQTGLDSFFATAGLLGWPIAALRVLTAFLSGLAAGLAVALAERLNPAPKPAPPQAAPSCSTTPSRCSEATSTAPSCCSGNSPRPRQPQPQDIPPTCCGQPSTPQPPHQKNQTCCQTPPPPASSNSPTEALRFALLSLPADIAPALLAGTAAAAALTALLPPSLLANLPGGSPTAWLLATLFALPVYVCSTGAIPLAYGLLAAGAPPGAAFILLTAGPSVSAATFVGLSKIAGPRAAALSTAALLIVVWSIATLVELFFGETASAAIRHEHSAMPLWKHASAVLLCLLFLISFTAKYRPSIQRSACCS